MTTIAINKTTRKMIDEYKVEGETVNDALNRLLDASDVIGDPDSIDYTKTNVIIHEDTLERLKKYKVSMHESHSDTILRLLLVLMHESTVI